MRKKYLIAILATVLLMAIFFFKDQSESPMAQPDSSEDLGAATSVPSERPVDADKIITQQASDSKTIKDKAAQGLSENQTAEIQRTFSIQLKQLGICLGIQPQVDSDKIAPTYENLLANLKPELGEVVVRMDDWVQQDLKYADGSMKRIRSETEYQDNGNPIKRIQLYKINAQGMPEMQPLNPDQSTDPSDEFLNSLRAEGQETLEEKGGRVYYQEGEELVLVERGGKIQSFSLTKGEKTFSCTETDSVTSNCQCL